MTASTDRRPGDDGYALTMCYDNLRPAADAADDGLEMAPIAHIAGTAELRHLAKHPLVASFLFLKWYRLTPAFYLNFVCFAAFCVSLIAYILCQNGAVPASLRPLLAVLVAGGTVYVLLRELGKLTVAPAYFVRNASAYLSLALVLLAGTLLADEATADGVPETWRRTVAAVAILLAVDEFFVLLGSLPVMSFSTHLVMLLTVARSFLRSLLLYAIMLVAFALCFCTLLGRDATSSAAVDDGADGDGDDDRFNQFESPGLAIVKTVVMLTGEFDAGSIGFANNCLSYLVFVVFVFLVSTVLFNLLNGLAVNDTQAIKADAELTNLIYRAEQLAKYERILGQGAGGW